MKRWLRFILSALSVAAGVPGVVSAIVESDRSSRLGSGSERYRGGSPSLRPHTMVIDLLFCAVMVFAFQMGSPNGHAISLKSLARAAQNAERKRLPMLLSATGADGKWQYTTSSGNTLTPRDVADIAHRSRKVPVLVVAGTTPISAYLEAEQPLRALGLTVGLAISNKGSGQ